MTDPVETPAASTFFESVKAGFLCAFAIVEGVIKGLGYFPKIVANKAYSTAKTITDSIAKEFNL